MGAGSRIGPFDPPLRTFEKGRHGQPETCTHGKVNVTRRCRAERNAGRGVAVIVQPQDFGATSLLGKNDREEVRP